MIGCDCRVCVSSDPKNRRRRSCLYIQAGGQHIIVDTPPDFREQALAYRVPRVTAILYTHSHADHIFGLDDIRRFNTMQGGGIPAYADPGTLLDLRRVFNYVEVQGEPEVYRPDIKFMPVNGPFSVGPVDITPVHVIHGPKPTLGYRLDADGCRLGYVPDCAELPDAAAALLAGCDVMILDALRHRPHKTHLTVDQSLAVLKRLGAKRSFIVHLAHDLDHRETEAMLKPHDVEVSFDGLTIEVYPESQG
jgi:phosphoribosyl 1,2-cyclic phosphate phosphodiesterase